MLRVISDPPPLWFILGWLVIVSLGVFYLWRQAKARRGDRLAADADVIRFQTPAVVKFRVPTGVWNPVKGPMLVSIGETMIRVAPPGGVGVMFGTDWPLHARNCEVQIEPHVGLFWRRPAIVLTGLCGGEHVELAIRTTAELEETLSEMIRAGAALGRDQNLPEG